MCHGRPAREGAWPGWPLHKRRATGILPVQENMARMAMSRESMQRILTIALGAFKESVRERVLYNLVVFAFLMIGAAILLGSISVGVQEIILINLGLTAIAVFGFLMAIFIGIGLVSKEIERRTIYNILSKPVRRYEFILGKFAGL